MIAAFQRDQAMAQDAAPSRRLGSARPICQSRPTGSGQTDARTAFGGPNQSKQNQINPRKKAWFSLDSFGRIQTFQRVTANPNKKIFPRFIVRRSLGAGLSSAALNKRALDSVIRKDIAQTFCFLKQMQDSRFARPWLIRRAKRGSETSSWAMVKRRSQQPTDGGKRASRPRQSRRARAPRSKAPACRGDLRSP